MSTSLIEFLKPRVPLLEQYLLSGDRKAYLAALQSETDRAVLTLLTSPLPEHYQPALAAIQVPESVYNELKGAEWVRRLRDTDNPELAAEAVHAIHLSNSHLNFQYTQPVPKQAYLPEQAERKALSSKLELEDDLSRYLNTQIQLNPNKISDLTNYGLMQIPFKTVIKSIAADNSLRDILKQEFILSLSVEDSADFLKTLLSLMPSIPNHPIALPYQFYKLFTTAQIAFLHKTMPEIMDSPAYYQYLFATEHQSKLSGFKQTDKLTLEQMLQRRNICSDIRRETQSLHSSHSLPIEDNLFQQMLSMDAKLGKVDPVQFVEFLRKDIDSVTKQFTVKQCLLALQKESDLEAIGRILKDCLPERDLQVFIAKGRLARGQAKDIPNLNALFTSEELEQLKEKKITVEAENGKTYTAESDVLLKLTIRNIRQVTVSVYCIDMERNCLEGTGQISSETSLRYLTPSHSRKIDLGSTDPFTEVALVQEIKELKGKMGTFVVDFEGDGISSRAVITKGGFLMENTKTPIGHQLRFFNSEGNPINEMTLWVGGKKEQMRDSYVIPYGPLQYVEIVAVLDGYAEKIAVPISSEDYTFSVNYIFTEESFIAGSKAKVVLNPRLRVNDCRVSLERLIDVKVQVETVSNLNILASEKFEHVLFNDNEDYVLEFAVKPYVQSIKITVNAEIQNMRKIKIPLSSQKQIKINLYEQSSSFIDIYLHRGALANFLQVRGKNGEPVPFAPTSIVLGIVGINSPSTHSLYTDAKGCIELGKLTIVNQVTATVMLNKEQITRTWDVNDNRASVSYGTNNLYFTEGDALLLPLPCTFVARRDFLLICTQGSKIENVTNSVVIKDNWLSYSPLQAGQYALHLLKTDIKLCITVKRGKKWGKSAKYYDPVRQSVFQIKQNEDLMYSLGEPHISSKQESIEVKIGIRMPEGMQLPSGMKVHAFATCFEGICGLNCGDLNKQNEIIYHNFTQRRPKCLNDKSLSEESSYVLSRKLQPAHHGNNLEKPHLFLKRTFVRSTEEQKERLNRERGYQNQGYMMDECQRQCAMQMCCDQLDYAQCQQRARHATLVQARDLCTHNNFLRHSAHLSANLHLSTLTMSLPKGYSALQVYLLSDHIALKRTYTLECSPASTIDLAHAGLTDTAADTGINVWRNVKILHSRDSVTISRDTLWIAVALPEIISYANIHGIKPPSWLIEWAAYSPEKRLKVYEENAGHEINCYLKKHYPEHFQEMIRPILRNKLVKTFVDLCLLEEETALEYCNIPKITKLNCFEKILLIQLLMKKGHAEQARAVAVAMEETETKTVKALDHNFNKNFDTILNSKKKEEPKSLFVPHPPPPGMAMAFSSTMNMAESYAAQPRMMMRMSAPQKQSNSKRKCKKDFTNAQQNYKKGYEEVEKTKQYIERTYEGVKDSLGSERIISSGLFWVQLAKHIAFSRLEPFVSKQFLKFNSKPEYTLAACFLPLHSAQYQLVSMGNSVGINALSSFALFTKELGSLPFERKPGMALRQRFCDAENRYTYDEEGFQTEKEVEQFSIRQVYLVDTIVSNTTPNTFETQLLLDIPEGALPLQSHENTQILTQVFRPWETKSFTRFFYFPKEGTFSLYPANATRNGKVIAKAETLPKIVVGSVFLSKRTENQSLEDILRSGSDEDVLAFLATRNIFDSFLFDQSTLLWKLKNKQFFIQVTDSLRKRKYFSESIWQFGYLHSDPRSIKELLQRRSRNGITSFAQNFLEYFPYYSSRAHSFADSSKSTIRNKQMLQSYTLFLFSALFERKEDSSFSLAFVYYLLLQDKFAEAAVFYNRVPTEHKNAHRMQSDYVQCFLDMTFGQHHDFKIARQISCKYEACALESWRNLFAQAKNTLLKAAEEEKEEESTSEITFTTEVINEGSQLTIKIPSGVTVTVKLFQINLELYFSEFPFNDVAAFSALTPSVSHVLPAGAARRETVKRESFKELRDIYAEIYEAKDGSPPRKVSSFVWTNPKVKVQLSAKTGTLRAQVDGQKSAGSYVKVYAKNECNESEFYRDGYVDVSGSFRYALAEVRGIQQFSMLIVTDKGGVTLKVVPPNLYHEEGEEQCGGG